VEFGGPEHAISFHLAAEFDDRVGSRQPEKTTGGGNLSVGVQYHED